VQVATDRGGSIDYSGVLNRVGPKTKGEVPETEVGWPRAPR